MTPPRPRGSAPRSSRRPNTLLLLTTVLLLAPVGGNAQTASDPSAWLHVDVDRGVVRATHGDADVQARVGAGLRTRLEELISTFARGQDDPAARRALGEELLAPLAPVLRESPRWTVRSPTMEATPGPLAPLAALSLPWDAEGGPVATHHELVFDWPVPAASIRGEPRRPAADPSGSVLLTAPFAPGVAPAHDDPDTLRRALRAAAARLELLPRNETDASALRRALENSGADLVWLRAHPEQIPPLRPAFGALPAVVVWSLPSRDPSACPRLEPRTFASGGVAPSTVVAQSWPVAETRLAPVQRAMLDALARGEAVGAALNAAQREAAAHGVSPAVWAAPAVVGDAGVEVGIDRAPWWRRLFGAG